ncbi:MAG: proton-conducting transporter membrane subunit [Desulfurococcaceae archaeon]
MIDPLILKLMYSTVITIPVLSGSILVDSYPRLSRVLRIMGFIAAPILITIMGYNIADYQLLLTLLASIIAIGVSLHNEGYYKVIYGLSRYFQVIVDLVLVSLILLFSSTYLVELIIYWFFLDLVIAFIAITIEHGTENLPVASTYIAMCIAPSDIALLTMWATLASKQGLFNSLLLQLNIMPSEKIPLDIVTSILILFGFATKLGQFPLHSWPPIVYGKAPSHISALLSGLVSKLGIYAFFMSSQLFVFNPIAFYVLLTQGLISTIYGSFGAVLQTDIKRILAYSSVSYYGIVTALFAISMILGDSSIYPVILTIVVFHSLMKSLAFINTALIYQVANTYDVYRLGYLYYVSREGALAAFIALLNMTGIPPSIGFIAKVLILSTSILLVSMNPISLALAVAIIVSAIFSIAYGVKYIGAYLGSLPRTPPRVIPIPKVELRSELYMGILSLGAPLVVLAYLFKTYIHGPLLVSIMLPIYLVTFTMGLIIFIRIIRKPVIPEDVKYWISGVES